MTATPRPEAAVAGYITDVMYPDQFQRETQPLWLVSVLAGLGRRGPDLTRPYTWLELGCGSGFNAMLAAAGNPLGRFIGIDANAEQIALARRRAQAAGLCNIEFHCLDFAQALADGTALPPCDFIVAHGVYSWVDEATRQAMRGIVARHLRPGGLFYVAYMSHPGAVSFSAAQRLMRMATRHVAGSSAERARAGLALIQRMAQAGAGYFVEHPAALREMQRVDQADANYLAHEFLNDVWHSMHVANVMAELAACGCDYAGSAVPLDNIDAVSLPGGMAAIVAEMRQNGADAAQLETAKDIARNQNQRRDIYQRPAGDGTPATMDADAHRAALLAQRVALLPEAPAAGARLAGELVFDTRIGPVRTPMAAVVPLLQALQAGPCSYAQLAALPAYARQPGFINQALQMLAWSGWLHFVRPDTTAHPDVSALNASLAQEAAATGARRAYQAAPRIGTAVQVDLADDGSPARSGLWALATAR